MRMLLERVQEHPELADLDPCERRLALRRVFVDEVDEASLGGVVAAVSDALDGFGPLTVLMRMPGVTDILVNGPREVWVERAGTLARSDVVFDDGEALLSLIERLVGRAGGRIDLSHPVADARLEDGSRLHVALPPVAPGGPLLSIRRFSPDVVTLEDLVRLGALTVTAASELREHVAARHNIVISGRTGSGKTTLLSALLREVPDDERVVVVEETAEIVLSGHRVRLVAREANAEGVGAVLLEDLVRASLRMRPDRIVVGEVRGPEALVALEALTTGHDGGLMTLHARSARHALERLRGLAARGPGAAPSEARDDLVLEAVDVVVHITKVDGRRRVTEIVCNHG